MTAVGEVPGASGRGPLTVVSWLDWKLGARLLLKYPALTIIGGLSLAGAIAIGAVGIEVADELLYKRLPFDEGGRVVRLETQDTAASRVEPRVLHDFAIWRRSLKTVAELGAARVSERNVLTGEGRVESLRVAEITASAFPLTRVPPLLGRPLQPTDEMQGTEPVVVLGYDVWQRQFLHDPAIIGRVVTVGRTARTVVGVMPPRFGFPHNEQAWVPLPVQDAPPREGPAVQVFGRLADGASWQDAAAELDVVSARFAADQPATHAQLRTRVRAFAGRTPGDPLRLEDLAVHAIVLLLLGAVSANVATLIFARTAMRESEIVVRHALGASRARVIAQIVTEGLVLALAAAVLGLVVAQTTVRYAWARASLITGDEPAVLGGSEARACHHCVCAAARARRRGTDRPAAGTEGHGRVHPAGTAGDHEHRWNDEVRRYLVVHRRRAGGVHPAVRARRGGNLHHLPTSEPVDVGTVSDGALPHLPPQDGQRGAGWRAGCA